MISKEEELQMCTELEDSLEKYKKANLFQRKTSNAQNEEKDSYVQGKKYITI